ncbi:MAG: heme-dependent oxidative N-demethylase family protein [Pseudomonadota bacterium]
MPRAFLEGPYKLAMGLHRLDLDDWLWVTEHYADEIAQKRRLLAEGADIVAELPEAAPAVAETLALIEEHLTHFAPHLLPGPGGPPLQRAGLLVQEDLCWMAAGPDGYRLIAAFLAFPARWRLADKLGRPMRAIHEPVPGFAERLGATADRFFANLTVERPVWRANWSILDDPALHQPEAKRRYQRIEVTPETAGHDLWLRVERQTLRRLPETGVVLFTIHTLVRPLGEMAADPDAAAALADRLDEMPDAMLAYKNLATLRPAVQAYLRGLAR